MNSEELKEEQKLIEEYIYRFYDKKDKSSEPIYDGIVNEEKYISSKYKIAWVLKEAYDEDDCKGGGWSLVKDNLDKENLYPEFIGNSPTLQTMIYVTYSLLNNFIPYSEMDYIRDMPEMAQSLREIAFININKMPAFRRSNDNEIYVKYQYWKPILHWQLKKYSPEIIIFGNTFSHFYEDLDLSEQMKKQGDCIDYFIKDKRLLISAYHPAQTQITKDRYVQGIIDVVKENVKFIQASDIIS